MDNPASKKSRFGKPRQRFLRPRLASFRQCFGGLLALASLACPEVRADVVVEQTIREFLQQQLEDRGQVTVEVLPSSARFPVCERPEPFIPASSPQLIGRVTVGLRCGGDDAALRYISAQVTVVGGYLKLATGVEPGTVLAAHMLEVARGDLGQLPTQAVLRMSDVVGQVAARRLSAGTVLQEQHLRALPLVSRGQLISLETGGRGFMISRKVEALDTGGLGDMVRVRLSRREILTAVVEGPGRVTPLR